MRKRILDAAGWLTQVALVVGAALCRGQVVPTPDAVQAAAEAWVGRALIVRGFPAGDELRYDSAGRVAQKEKATDWTLAGFELQKVLRRGNGELQLDGVRVAIRYNLEQHTFERHLVKEEPMRIVFPALAAAGTEKAMASIFSVGIDPALQRSMPGYWSHFFIPTLAWPEDGLEGKAVIGLAASTAAGVVYPEVEKKSEPGYTGEATWDKVHGTVQVKAVVDTQGVAQRITIRQPLGYGLDAKVVEAVAKYKFRPGAQAGKPVAMEVVVNLAFD